MTCTMGDYCPSCSVVNSGIVKLMSEEGIFLLHHGHYPWQKKVMTSVFWDKDGVTMFDYFECGLIDIRAQ